jgi:hypothetical protein
VGGRLRLRVIKVSSTPWSGARVEPGGGARKGLSLSEFNAKLLGTQIESAAKGREDRVSRGGSIE